MKSAATVTVAVLSACCTTCNFCADALQSSSSFPQTPRGQNIAQRYLDEGHPFSYGQPVSEGNPFTYDPTYFIDGAKGTNGPGRAMQATAKIEISAAPDCRNNFESYPPLEEINESVDRRPRITLRRKSKLAPRSRSPSMLPTRRKSQKSQIPPSPDLLTFEEETEIAESIKNFRSVTKARDTLLDWMSREFNRAGGNQPGEPSEFQWAAACSLTVDQLHDVVNRGQEARTRLIRGNVGLVTMIGKRYYNMLKGGTGRTSGGGAGGTDATLKLDDLIQEGYMGIMEAAERFDPTKGFRFSTYATHWIRQRILRSIAESSRIIRLPVHVQTSIRNMHKKTKELELQTGRPPSSPEIAHEMGVPVDKIHLYQHLSKNVLSLEQSVDRHSNTEDKRTLGDRVAQTEMATPDEDLMSEALRGEVHALLDALGHEERLVLTHRFGLDDGKPKSIRETAEGMGVSGDVVRKFEAKALNKLRSPRMNYRLKDYVRGSDGFAGDSDYAQPYHHDTQYSMTNMEDQQQPHYHYPHHMNPTQLETNVDQASNDDLREYKRPTPESIWSF